MNNKRIFLTIILAVICMALAACGNSTDDSSTTLDNQPQNSNSPKNTNNDSSIGETTEESPSNDTDDNNESEEAGTSDDSPVKEEAPSANRSASLKDEYGKKLSDTKKEVEEAQLNDPGDTSTYALKKIEGDRYELWDELLNDIYSVLKEQLPADEMVQLREEQRNWIKQRDDSAKEASLKYEGGTAEQLEYVAVLANLTEERCYELVEIYMK